MPDFDDAFVRTAQQATGYAPAFSGAVQYDSGQVDDATSLRAAAPHEQYNRTPGRNEMVVPDYSGHPIPEVPSFLFVAFRTAGVAPPWYVRVSPALCAKYGMRKIAIALDPHAKILMTADGNHPAPMFTLIPAPLPGDPGRQIPRWQIEFCLHDQPHHVTPTNGTLWLPDDLGRTTRTI